MSNVTKLVDQILSKDFVEADKLFESVMAERVMQGFAMVEENIQEQIAYNNPELFRQLDEVVDDSELDKDVKADHEPVDAPISEPIPEPVDVDGHRGPDHDEEESEEVYEQIVVESHDFDDDRADDEEHPENVGAEPVGDPAANQASIASKPSDASPAQVEEELSPKQKKIDINKNGKVDGEDLKAIRNESLDHSGVMCEMCGEEGHVLDECTHDG